VLKDLQEILKRF